MAGISADAVVAAGPAGAPTLDAPEMLALRPALADVAADGVASLGGSRRKESLVESIKRLKDEQAAMKAAKAALQKELKNACKRKNRLKKRARQLTDLDLLEVLQMRKEVTPMELDGVPAIAAEDHREVGEDGRVIH